MWMVSISSEKCDICAHRSGDEVYVITVGYGWNEKKRQMTVDRVDIQHS